MTTVSIVVPVYNVEKYLESCVNSIIHQDFKDIEILLIDDGSTDSSSKICDDLKGQDSRIRVYHKKNGGLSDARNYGTKLCTGKYVTFIDSDDTVDTSYVSYLLNLILTYKADMSICSHRTILHTGKVIGLGRKKEYKLSSTQCMREILYDKVLDISAWAKLYKIELFNGIEFPKGKLFEDAYTTYKLVMKSSFIAVGEESKYTYMVRKNSIVTSGFSEKKFDLINACQEMENSLIMEHPELKDALNRKVVFSYLSTLNSILDSRVVEYQDKIQKMRKVILRRGKIVLKDKEAASRDKIAIIALFFGINTYQLIWNNYQRISGKV
ncbi:glycosyltransferase family 2 protein [Latilactobacillus sakei]|uniref:glycosyltransferase family 2 protein n=1 Tax=Latilactobacillus sakei TaxID=1599 RepID=UPI00232A9C22|nr:glycosyltransferase family 2 protein [Latilactobacillus sakei]MDB1553434.1 glycosyltransferase family 2 protein [Latilactobacillus sakei]